MMKIYSKSENILLAGIILVAIILRFYLFDQWSLSNDELSALSRLQYESLNQCIRDGVKFNDFHPAGVEVFLWYWTGLFGSDVWVVRLPFVIMGICSVIMVYVLGKQWFNKNVALLSAASLAILEYPILFSQLARPYSPGLLFVLLYTYFWM